MSGEIQLEQGGWRRWAPWLVSLAAAVLLLLAAAAYMARRGLSGIGLQIGSAVIALALYWGLKSYLTPLFAGGGRTVRWTLTEDVLDLGGDIIPRVSIRKVYCWKKGENHIVNIETDGKKHLLLRPAPGGDEALRALVEALGYGRNWET